MEEEIICNRWKDLADGPKGRESGPSVMVFLSSGTNYFSLPILSSRILIQDARKNTIHTRDFSESYLGESFDWNRNTGNVQ